MAEPRQCFSGSKESQGQNRKKKKNRDINLIHRCRQGIFLTFLNKTQEHFDPFMFVMLRTSIATGPQCTCVPQVLADPYLGGSHSEAAQKEAVVMLSSTHSLLFLTKRSNRVLVVSTMVSVQPMKVTLQGTHCGYRRRKSDPARLPTSSPQSPGLSTGS